MVNLKYIASSSSSSSSSSLSSSPTVLTMSSNKTNIVNIQGQQQQQSANISSQSSTSSSVSQQSNRSNQFSNNGNAAARGGSNNNNNNNNNVASSNRPSTSAQQSRAAYHPQTQPRPIQPNYHSHHHHNNKDSTTAVDSIDPNLFESIEYPFCADHSKYEQVAKIGQGTFGEVYKARCKKTQEFVALKKVLTENEKEGFPITALREIKILQVLRHENIVHLIEICTSKATSANKYKSQFYLVFEFCEHDLAGLLSNPSVKFSLGEQKRVMQQLLNGLYYIHQNFILHRDMKTANILVTKEGKLKLADFGLARAIEQQKFEQQQTRYTNRVVTLWYRPPELLLGERCYNKAIDMWGAGCIMAELWTREPILKGNSEQNQLELIQSICGSISSDVWPDVEKLELFNKMQLKPDLKRRLKERLGVYIKDQNGLELLDKLLTLDPKKRIDSNDALDHDFFWTDPFPSDLKLEKLNSSMFEYTAQNFRRNQYRQSAKPAGNEQQHYDRVY